MDLRVPNSEKYVTEAQGKKLRNKIKAYAFVECSAKDKINLENVFHEAIHAIHKKPRVKTISCQIL